MGLFDEVTCKLEVPECKLPAGTLLQTKSLNCSMGQFSITEQGRLVSNGHMQSHMPDRDMDFHGDLELIGKNEEIAIHCVARFTHGTLEWIRPIEALPETERIRLAARD